MANKGNQFGPESEQSETIKRLTWPMFVGVVELLGMDINEFIKDAAPAARSLAFKTLAEASQVTPIAIEIALIWILKVHRLPLLAALKLLDLDGGTDGEGSVEWLTHLSGLAHSRSLSLAALKAALLEAKGKGMGTAPAAWKGPDASTVEKIMGGESTLLPIHFLELALRRSTAVAKIETPAGSGTGFVIPGNLLVTNAHVLSSADVAHSSEAVFNFQKSPDLLDRPILRVAFDPATRFLLSPENQHDLAIVALAEAPAGRWGEVPLPTSTVAKGDRVCIIQHPGGDQKHVGMYHNVVTYSDTDIVQYLTDTLPGSSGAPVFDKDWKLVAIHHAGGWLVEPGQKEKLFRNEGITAAHLVKLLNS